MTHVIFAVPFAMDATLRFVQAACDLRAEGLRLGVLSQDRPERFPEALRSRFDAFHRVPNAMDAESLTEGVRHLARSMDGRVDRVIGILEPLQEALAEVRERLDIPGMRPEAAANFRDKARMKDLLRANGLPCAGHRLCMGPEEAFAFGRESGYPLVVKPPAGAGARNTFRVDDESELAGYLRSMPPRPSDPVLLEEFLSGSEFSFDTVTLNGRHLLHNVTEYAPTPLEVMQTPWIQWAVVLPRDISGPDFRPIHEAGARALDVLGMDTGITHMEWFRRDDGSIAISEVAARPPGAQFTTLLGYAHDLDFYEAWVRLVTMDRFDVPERRWSTGAAFLRAQGEGRVARVRGLEEAQAQIGDLVVEAKLPQAGQPKASSYEGEGYVILRDADTDRVRDGLQLVVSLLRVDLEQGGAW